MKFFAPDTRLKKTSVKFIFKIPESFQNGEVETAKNSPAFHNPEKRVFVSAAKRAAEIREAERDEKDKKNLDEILAELDNQEEANKTPNSSVVNFASKENESAIKHSSFDYLAEQNENTFAEIEGHFGPNAFRLFSPEMAV